MGTGTEIEVGGKLAGIEIEVVCKLAGVEIEVGDKFGTGIENRLGCMWARTEIESLLF